MESAQIVAEIERIRPELNGYLRRLLASRDADDVIQNTAVRALSAQENIPVAPAELRPWLFRIATNLALDELRRRGRWKQDVLIDARTAAESDEVFVAMSSSLRGSESMKLIAKEHLVACFVCTLRTLSPERSATLLLREVYGFTNEEIAVILDARSAQIKNWLQDSRRTMELHFDRRCMLIRKEGVCYQCSELAQFFGGRPENPLAATHNTFDERLRILEALRERVPNRWHDELFAVIDDL